MIDLAIMGAGMAGLSAAARAAHHGLRVCVFERANEIGGASLIANGNVWTARTLAALRAEDPAGDPKIGAALVEDFPRATEWLQEMGQACAVSTRSLAFGRGWEIDTRAYLQACCETVRATHGEVLTDACVSDVLLEGHSVRGIRVTRVGVMEDVRSRWTLLAGGGFQANPELRRRHLGSRSDTLLLRSSNLSTGDGLRFALAAGAGLSKGMGRFYGHLVCTSAETLAVSEFYSLAQYQSDHGILLNHAGSRFTDESLGDHQSVEAVLREPESRAVLIFDDRVARIVPPPASLMQRVDKVALAAQAGGRAVSHHSLETLADTVSRWGYPRDAVLSAVRTFNAGLDGRSTSDPPRARNRFPVAFPPFRALEVRPSITFTKGGVRVDSYGCALSATGARVPGLLVAGNDAGGIFLSGYAGGLAAALVFGLRAADVAAAN